MVCFGDMNWIPIYTYYLLPPWSSNFMDQMPHCNESPLWTLIENAVPRNNHCLFWELDDINEEIWWKSSQDFVVLNMWFTYWPLWVTGLIRKLRKLKRRMPYTEFSLSFFRWVTFSPCYCPGNRYSWSWTVYFRRVKRYIFFSLIPRAALGPTQHYTESLLGTFFPELKRSECEFNSSPVPLPSLWKLKVKFSRYRPGVAQRVGRGVALLFHDRGTRRMWVVSSMPRPQFTPGKDPVPILQEVGWPQGRSGRAENLVPTGARSRTVQPVAQSLYRLSYPAHNFPFTLSFV